MMRYGWVISAILVCQLTTTNQAPTIQGVNSAVIGISQAITMNQLVAHFLVFSDDHDTLTSQDLNILEGSTCDLEQPSLGSCVFLFQIKDHELRLSEVFPFELTWIDDTKPIMEGPSTIWINPNYPIDHEWVESICNYDRTSLAWEVISVDSEGTFMVVAVSDAVDNRYYHRIAIVTDESFPMALGWKSDDHYGLSMHSQFTLSQEDLNYVSQLWHLSIEPNQTSWDTYLLAPYEETSFELGTDGNETLFLEIQTQFGRIETISFWDAAWQFVIGIYDWVVMQCQNIWQSIVDFFLSLPPYRIL